MAAAAGRRPLLLFINQHYHPDVAATAQHLADLSEYLALQDYFVEILCTRGRYQAGHLDAAATEVRNRVSIRRYWTPGAGRQRNIGRMLDYASFMLQVAGRLLFGASPAAIVSLTTPPMLPALTAFVKRIRGVPYAIWSMDLHPEAEVAAGMLRRDGVLGRILFSLADDGYRNADFVVVLGECMRRLVVDKGVAPDRSPVVHVWTRREDVEPVPRAENRLAAELGIGLEDFVVMYSGNAGLAHVFDPFLQAARSMQRDGGTRFLFVGDGPRRKEIEGYAQRHGLNCLSYLDYFPRERLAESLSLADVHLASLRQEFAGISVPAKLYGIMAAERPLLFVGPTGSEVGRIVIETGCGMVVDMTRESQPGIRVTEVLRQWQASGEVRRAIGSRARAAFLSRFERQICCAAFEREIDERWALARRPPESGRLA